MELKGRDRTTTEKLDSRDMRKKKSIERNVSTKKYLLVGKVQEHTIQIEPNGRINNFESN